MENDTKIIERRLKDVSDPLSEEDEDSTPASGRSLADKGSYVELQPAEPIKTNPKIQE